MANQRSTFSKRNREMKLKDKARDKAERKAARAANPSATKGPQIDWNTPGGINSGSDDLPTPNPAAPDDPAAGGGDNSDDNDD